MERKYYEAYDDRYRQVHEQKLQWFYDNPTPIVAETIVKYSISRAHAILEIGCGEGRDAYPLLHDGYSVLATDISVAAIDYARKKYPQFAAHFTVLDCVTGKFSGKFDFIYAIAVLHMLVDDVDRDAFYRFIREYLRPNGIALICTMGDGIIESKTDITTAFDLQNRVHEQSGREVRVANTSCRMVSFDTFHNELRRNHLSIIEEGITSALPDFSKLMYAVVKT